MNINKRLVNEIINKYWILIFEDPLLLLMEKIHIKQRKIGELSVQEFSKIFCANREKLYVSMRNNQLKTSNFCWSLLVILFSVDGWLTNTSWSLRRLTSGHLLEKFSLFGI